jgi:hypothetical protein
MLDFFLVGVKDFGISIIERVCVWSANSNKTSILRELFILSRDHRFVHSRRPPEFELIIFRLTY